MMCLVTLIVSVFGITSYIKDQRRYTLSSSAKSELALHDVVKEEVLIQGTSDRIVVHVEGEVVSPGVYELKEDSRVHDAILAAGGLLETADRKKINLAKKVIDEEFVYIPNENDEDSLSQTITLGTTGSINNNDGLVDINLANLAELKTLSGIGDVLGGRIIEYREKNGEFQSVDDLKNVSGIGDKKFSDIKDKVKVR